MAIVLLSYLNILLASLGMGMLFLFLIGIHTETITPESLLKIGITGFCINLATVGYISLVGPVDSWINLGITAISFTALIRFIILNHDKIQLKRSIAGSKNAIPVVLLYLLLLVFSISNASLIPQINDTWFYHLQAIKWIEEYGVTKGLGNLFSNIAYNSSVFTGNAVFSLKPITGQNYFGVNSFLWLTTLLLGMFRSIRFLAKKDYQSVLTEGFAIFLVYRYFHLWLSSSGQDPASASILVFCFFIIRDLNENQENDFNKIALSSLLITLVTIKLSNALLVVPAVFVLYSCRKSFAARSIYLVMLPLFILAPWLIRNILLSGYLVYPFHSLDLFNVDWKIPQAQVIYEEMLIRSWALKAVLPDSAISIFPAAGWFSEWFSSIGLFFRILLSGALISIIISSWYFIKKRGKYNSMLLIFWGSVTLSLIFWFLTAPSPRFVYGMMLVIILIPFEFVTLKSLLLKYKYLHLFGIIVLTLFAIEPEFRGEKLQYPSGFSLIVPPDFPKSETSNSIYNGILLNYADPAVSLQSFNTEIPCTPQLRKGLVLRGNDLSDGFRINPDLCGPGESEFINIKKYYESQKFLPSIIQE